MNTAPLRPRRADPARAQAQSSPEANFSMDKQARIL